MPKTTTYRRRFWARLKQDMRDWVTQHLVVGSVFAVLPMLLLFLAHISKIADFWSVGAAILVNLIAFILYCAWHIVVTPKKLDDERATTQADLEGRIETLTEKLKRNPAEEADFQHAATALAQLGEKAKIALTHLRRHGPLLFGTYPPHTPPGMATDEIIPIYNQCANLGLITYRLDPTPGGGKEFHISPAMEKVLSQLL